MYKKGDTFELRSGKVVLVLKDGLTAEDFNSQYKNQKTLWVNMRNGWTWILIVNNPDDGTYCLQPFVGDICYNIMMGDVIGWVRDDMIRGCIEHE